MASLIEDLRAHGGVYRGGSGGGGDVKFVKYTASLDEPQNPSVNDLWVKTDQPLGTVYIDNIDLPNPSVGDTLIKFGGREDLFKPSYYKSKSDYFGFRSKTSNRPLMFDSDIITVHGIVGTVKTWNGEFYDYHDSYVWNGTEWYAFSYNLGGIIMIGAEPPTTSSSSMGISSHDDSFDLMVKTDDTPVTRYLNGYINSCVDPIRKLLCTQTSNGYFRIYNYNTMELLKEVRLELSSATNPVDIHYCKFDSYGNLFIATSGSTGTTLVFLVLKYDSDFNKVSEQQYLSVSGGLRIEPTISYINNEPYVFSRGVASTSCQIVNLVTKELIVLTNTMSHDKTLSIGNVFYGMSSGRIGRWEYDPIEKRLIETHTVNVSTATGSSFGTDGKFLYVQANSQLQKRNLDNLSMVDFNTTSSGQQGLGIAPYISFDRGFIYAPRSQNEIHQLNKKTFELEKIKTTINPNHANRFISKIGEYNSFPNMV